MNQEDAARARLRVIDREIQALRGPAQIPSLKPEPLPPARIQRLMELAAEAAVHHVRVREYDEARRAIADTIVCTYDVVDPAAIARASLLTGEALVELDSPNHARTRLEIAVKFYDKVHDENLATRARTAMARALMLLDDPDGLEMLRHVHANLIARGDTAGVARVEAWLREIRGGGDAAQTVRAGYGRAVSMIPGSLR